MGHFRHRAPACARDSSRFLCVWPGCHTGCLGSLVQDGGRSLAVYMYKLNKSIDLNIYIYVCVCALVYTNIHIRVHMYIHMPIHVHIHVHVHMHIHCCTHARMHTGMHAYIYLHAQSLKTDVFHIHIYSQAPTSSSSSSKISSCQHFEMHLCRNRSRGQKAQRSMEGNVPGPLHCRDDGATQSGSFMGARYEKQAYPKPLQHSIPQRRLLPSSRQELKK